MVDVRWKASFDEIGHLCLFTRCLDDNFDDRVTASFYREFDCSGI